MGEMTRRDLGVDGMIILKWFIMKKGTKIRTDSTGT
jgi:hypothetical protein